MAFSSTTTRPSTTKSRRYPTIEFDALVGDGKWNLAFECEIALGKLEAKALLVGGFQETGAEGTMNLDARADDVSRNSLRTLCLCASVVHSCSASQRSASMAAAQPWPAAVMAWR